MSAPPPSPCPAPFNMARYVLEAGEATPEKTALAVLSADGAEEWTYARLSAAVRGTAAALLDRGLAPGDRVLLRLGNTPEFPVCFLACIVVGLFPVPTSAQLTAPEITGMAADLAPAVVIAAEGVALPDHPAPVLPVADLTATGRSSAPWDMGAPDRPAYIVFTSGTSGRPRAVVHAHRAVWARRMMWDGWYGLTGDDRLLHAGAFNWTYTLGTGLMDPWARGATALIPAAGTPPAALPGLLARHDATLFAAAPGVFRQMLRAEVPPLPALRHGLSAGEKLSETLREAWRAKTGTEVHEAYGMSECSTFLSGAPHRPAPADTLGYPQPGRRLAILADGTPAPPGQPGMIAVHRSDPGLMLGYLDAAGETAEKFAGDWFLTSDTGVEEPDGAIRFLGRSDDMMNAGGYRVSPVEVEEAMVRHPALAETAACELRVREDTSIIALFYAGTPCADAELAAFAQSRLARYKCPRLFIHVESLPRGANNKLLRHRLRREWETANGQA